MAEVSIRIKAEAAQAQGVINRFAKNSASAFDKVGASASRTTAILTTLRRAVFAYGSYRIATALYSTIAELEQGWIGVAKTTGMAGKELETFKESIRSLSVTMSGLKVEELQNIATVAGQLGIKGVDNLTNFTRVVGMMTVATELTADTAATAFARIANIMHEPIANLENLGSIINELSNNTTATASDIVDFTQAVGGAAANIGLTSAEVFALGATIRDLGVETGVAGTALSQVFLKMLTNTDKFAVAAGISVEQFTEIVRTRPIAALQLLSANMAKLGTFGAAKALSELGLEGQRTGGVLLKLAKDEGTLAKNLRISNGELVKGTSLQKEYEVASKGLTSQTTQAWNSVKLLAEQLGIIGSPVIKGALGIAKVGIDNITLSLKALISLTETPGPANLTQKLNELNAGLVDSGVEGYVKHMKELLSVTKDVAAGPIVDANAAIVASVKSINQAFNFLDVQSSGQLVEMADKAVAAFIRIKESGMATPGDIYRAYLAASDGIKDILDGLKGGAEIAEPEGGLKFAEDLEAAGEKGYTAIKEFQDKRAAEWDAYWNSKQFSTGPAADISAVEERLKSLKDAFEGVKTGQTFSPVVKVEGVEDAIGKVKSLDAQLKALTASPTVIDIKGRGSATLPISQKIEDIKTMFGSLEDLSPQVTADFSAVSAGIQSARESIANQFAAFSQNQLVQSEVSRQASLGQGSFDATMKLFEKFQTGSQTNLGGVNININGGSDPAATARAVRAELKKLEGRL